ncbi:hypothetical protein [Streptomyces sp. CS014]|uniref:hypothetical protein n=1 Tax=Streptomyces sp. CS014 TaxID=2162707 RepID=UPI000D519E0C|nr:hypothetical protein [Streptomyces sp. CS014]PVD04450.1 hypothetical protein DBP12_03225 [Streptomyces sp. CS014]
MNEDERIQSIQAQAQGLQDQDLECRFWGHSWLSGERPIVIDIDTLRYESSCQRCDAWRWVETDLLGAVLRRGGRTLEGYLLKGTGRLSTSDRDLLRGEYIRRTIRN